MLRNSVRLMMKATRLLRRPRVLFPLWVLFCLSSSADAQVVGHGNRFEDDPAARKRYFDMIDAFRNAQSLSFQSDFQRGVKDGDSSACHYQAWLKKPNFFRLESRSKDGTLSGVLIGDGDRLWIHWPNGRPGWQYVPVTEEDEKSRFKSYMIKPARKGQHSIWHEALFLGGGMSFPVFELSTFHGAQDPLERSIDGVRFLGTETIEGELCDKVHVSLLDGQRHWTFSISRGDHLPRKLEELVKVSDNRFAAETWTNIVVDGAISDSKFDWKPPSDWVQWQLPPENPLGIGTEAPDFRMTLTDGTYTKLSDYRGKTVWLVFWRLGCPPCREETPLLQSLHQRHKDSEFTVLSVNVTDDRKLVLEYLRKNEVSFPNILDTSEQANRVCSEQYNGGSVPLNYLIDQTGKIVEAAFEFAPVEAALKKLRPDLDDLPGE